MSGGGVIDSGCIIYLLTVALFTSFQYYLLKYHEPNDTSYNMGDMMMKDETQINLETGHNLSFLCPPGKRFIVERASS
jgi:hypothetical protein